MRETSGRRKPPLPAAALFEFAVKSLGARACSTGELRRKLVQRAEHAADVDEVISRLRDYGYLNDKRFAENYAGARLENQGLGRSRVLRDLRQRKVSDSLATGAVERLYKNVDEMELIDSFIRRKIRTSKPLPEALEDPSQLASAYRKLIRAGFGSSNVILALKRIAKGRALLENFEPPEEVEE
jgi:regulatory protein